MKAYTCLVALLKLVSHLGGTECAKVVMVCIVLYVSLKMNSKIQRDLAVALEELYTENDLDIHNGVVKGCNGQSCDKRGGLDEASHPARGEMGVEDFGDTDHCYRQHVFNVTP